MSFRPKGEIFACMVKDFSVASLHRNDTFPHTIGAQDKAWKTRMNPQASLRRRVS